MNKKQLLLLVGLGVLLAVVAAILARKQTASYQSATRQGANLLDGFDPNAVALLHLRSAADAVTLTKQGEIWVVRERGGYPANFNAISDLMRKFWGLKVVRAVPTGPARLPQLGLAGPGTTSTLVEMKDASGRLLRSILLGAPSQNQSRGWPNGRYVMLGNDPQTVCLVADSLADVTPALDHWLDKDFVKVGELKAITVVTPVATNNWKLARDSVSTDWKLAEAKPDEKLDSSKTSTFDSLLSGPSFNDVMPGTAGLDKPIVATLEGFDGFTYVVKFARQTDDLYELQLAVSAQLPQARTPAKNEKPDEAARLDKEFKDTLQELQQKLKAEQSYANWTYLVPKWTIEPLLKTRRELLAEKTPEPKSPTPPPAAAK